MKPYYYVLNRTSTAGFNMPSVKHDSLELAVAEAERLAQKHPSHVFEVLKCVAITKVTKPSITFYLDGVEPSSF